MPVAPSPARLRDPYEFHPEEVAEPPRSLFGILRHIGPGIILSASIVGSGELIATTTLGAEVGYIALWIIILSCLIKPAVQSEIGRYIIATGRTGAEGFNLTPGPKFKGASWVVWAWAAMTIMSWFQIGAMFAGVSQVLGFLAPAVPFEVWVFALLALSLVLLLGGGYARIENIATIKVALFTMLTFLCALIMVRMPGSFSWEQLADGLKFDLPGSGIATAVAVFGITGVGASELFMYPYWCVEKGYARYAGKPDGTPEWQNRVRGWTRVMNVDIVVSMIIYCVATIAFYFLGAGILHTRGLVPSAHDMIAVLSTMYTETLGPWAVWLFYIGAIATLYGTIFAATAGNSRIFADMFRVMGFFERGDYRARVRMRDRLIWFHLVVPIVMLLVFRSPVNMVKAGGVAQAMMLPLIAVGALYMRHKGLPKQVAPGTFPTLGLWFAAAVIIAVVLYSGILSIRSLY
jgi:Mn2+/Fe2+ NRAMP family transporter